MSNIVIVPCAGCGESILCWNAAPSAICYRCERERQGQQNKREQERLGWWTGGGAL